MFMSMFRQQRYLSRIGIPSEQWTAKKGETLTSSTLFPKPFHEGWEFGYEGIIAAIRTSGARQRKEGGGGDKTD